jgi:hypothetical protein
MAVVAERVPEARGSSTNESRILAALRSAVIAAPDRIVTVFLSVCIPIGLAVTFRVFTPALVIPAAVIFAVGFWFLTPARYVGPSDGPVDGPVEGPVDGSVERAAGRAALGAAIAGVGALLWILVNRQYVAEFVVLQRDPGIYTLRAMWLTDHSTPLIDMSAEALHAGGQPGVSLAALAFPVIGETIYPQSSGLVPGLLATFGWVKGLTGVLVGNVVIGAVALLAVYALARRLVGPLWALVPFGALALGMPMIAFSRAPYSEPTALVATFGGLLLLWVAWERRRVLGFVVAGLLMGVGSLARIDGGIAIVGVLAAFGVVTLFARSSETRRRAALYATAYFLAVGLMNGLGLLDASRNSPIYLKSESHNVTPLTVATVASWVVVVGFAFLPLDGLRGWLAEHSRAVARIAGIGSAVVGLVLLSRPLWWTARSIAKSSWPTIANMQVRSGLANDPARSYDESSVSWLAMYQGWIAVLLAGLGVAMLAARIVRTRDPRIVMLVVTVASASLLYLNKISIFPDQIWAMRRFLPIIIPGLLIAAIYPLQQLARRRRPLTWVAAGLAAATLGGALLPWAGPVPTAADGGGQVAEMQQSCAIIDGRPVVLTGPNPGPAYFLPTFKIGCGVETLRYATSTPEGLAKIRANYGTDVLAVTFDPAGLTWTTGAAPPPTISSNIVFWGQPLQKPPTTIGITHRNMWIGIVQADGRVTPIAGAAG